MDIVIREYRPADRAAVRKLSCETAFLGYPWQDFLDDDEILADILTSYFLDHEPSSCFVAQSGQTVIGYIIGAKNASAAGRITAYRIMPRALLRAASRGVFFKKKTLRLLMHYLISFFRGEFFAPGFSKEYPGTLHINIEKQHRQMDIGADLISRFFGFLKQEGVGGVHLGTMSEGAKEFFEKIGFRVLYESRHSYMAYVTGKAAPYYILGKRT